MATKSLLPTTRPLLRTLTPSIQQTRTFLPDPSSFLSQFAPQTNTTPQKLSATRTLPYPSAPIYSIIADIPSYSAFLPYCEASRVTAWSSPDSVYNRRWPSQGKLVVGFKGLSEEFTSAVWCVPGRVVESVAGVSARGEDLKEEDLRHHFDGKQGGIASGNGEESPLLSHLRNRWTVQELGKEETKVTLSLEFAFSNPIYTALSAGAAPKVAEVMVKAFEERVRKLLDGNPEMVRARLEDLEGSGLRRR